MLGFAGVVAALFILRVTLGYVALPMTAALVLTLLVTAVFVALPVFALFWGAAKDWKAGPALLVTVVGAALHLGCFLLLRSGSVAPGMLSVVQALMQSGVPIWCLGLGALVSILVKEKNMVLPIALFLAGMDALLILAPMTPQAKVIQQNPEILKNLAYSVPQVKQQSKPGETVPMGAVDLAYIGPADLFISGMFFCSLFRYKMRARRTLLFLVPALFVYLIVVLAAQFPLPALVPIGLTVLLVNRKEFSLSGEEKAATWLVAVIAVAMAGLGLWLRLNYKPPVPQSELSPPSGAQESVGQAGSPETGQSDPRR